VVLGVPILKPDGGLPQCSCDVNVVEWRDPVLLLIHNEVPNAALEMNVEDEEEDQLSKLKLDFQVLLQIEKSDQPTQPEDSYKFEKSKDLEQGRARLLI